MLEVKLLKPTDVDAVQKVVAHPDVVGWLGGFLVAATKGGLADPIKKQTFTRKDSPPTAMIWGAWLDEQLVGFTKIESRSPTFFMKNGSIGVLPEFRRERIGTALLYTQMVQAVIEGKRLIEDTIVGDNPYNSNVLPTLGYKLVGTLPEKTASFKDINLYSYQVNRDWLYTPKSRLPTYFTTEVIRSPHTQKSWNENMESYARNHDEILQNFSQLLTDLVNEDNISFVNPGGQQAL